MRLRLLWAVVLFLLLAGSAMAAGPGAPWYFDLLVDTNVTNVAQSHTFTLENVSQGHILYHVGASGKVTGTLTLTVTEAFDGVTSWAQQTATGSFDNSTEVSGIITLTCLYPDIAVALSTDSATAIPATIAVWQR